MRITALIENTSVHPKCGAEHGLSLYVETGGRKILFDMGQSELLLSNAQALGVELSRVDIAVLSHGHYDHGGGLSAFLRVNRHAPVFLSGLAFGDHYNGFEKYIGLDQRLREEPRLVFVNGDRQIGEGLTLSCARAEDRADLRGSAGLNLRTEEGWRQDPFLHEQYLLVEEAGRRILFSGCSHRGILEIVDRFRPDVLIGGFHLSKMPTDEALSELGQRLNAYPTVYYTCHCTGEAQFAHLKGEIQQLHYLSCGESVTV